MTTEKPTCPFCLRGLHNNTWKPSFYRCINSECVMGTWIGEEDREAWEYITAAVVEIRERDWCAGWDNAIFGGAFDDGDTINDAHDYIDRLKKSEAKK